MKANFIAQVNNEFGIREWSSSHVDGSFMTIKQKVAKLKVSLMEGRLIKVMRDSIR